MRSQHASRMRTCCTPYGNAFCYKNGGIVNANFDLYSTYYSVLLAGNVP